MRCARSVTTSRSSVHAPDERYFHPASGTSATIVPASIVAAILATPAMTAPDEIPAKIPHSSSRRRVLGRELLRLADRAVAAFLPRRRDHLGAEDLEHLPALLGHVLGEHDAQPVSLHTGDEGEPDARVAGRRLEDRVARLQHAVAF